jgi:type IX secretion system PorP/SprF family membrane protein
MKKYTVFCWLIITNLSLWGQSDIDLNHHWFWRLDNNPSTIKNNGSVEFDCLGRFQWAGFYGAPQTYMASVSGVVSDINSGFAALAMIDVIGFTQKHVFKGLYSYTFSLSETSMLALGISGGISQNSLAQDKITVVDDVANPDLLTYYLEDNGIKPDIDFGFTYSFRTPSAVKAENKEPLFQLGASITHLNQIFNTDEYKTVSNYYGYAALNIPLWQRQMRFIPGVSVVRRGNITAFELNATLNRLSSNKNIGRFWFGGTLKLRGNEIALFGGLDIGERIGLGYSTDITYSSVGNKSRTSHEIMIMIRFTNRKDTNCASFPKNNAKKIYNARCNNFVM